MKITEYEYNPATCASPADGKSDGVKGKSDAAADGTFGAPLCAALGFFDGVHIGHRALIADTVSRARELGLRAAVITFPAEATGLRVGAARIYSTEEKLQIFRELSVDEVVLCDFSSVSGLSPLRFVSDVLVGDLGVRVAFAGEDFRFGHRAAGDSAELKRLMTDAGGDAVIHGMERVLLPEGETTASATLIREYLFSGKPRRAASLLGAPYKVSGRVERGDGRGHTLGYPTVNTELRPDVPLARGVYRTEVKIDGKSYTGLTNVGVCPTFGARILHAETYILGFSGDVYGKECEIFFLDYVRGERSFSSEEELRLEIDKNIKEISADTFGGMEDL